MCTLGLPLHKNDFFEFKNKLIKLGYKPYIIDFSSQNIALPLLWAYLCSSFHVLIQMLCSHIHVRITALQTGEGSIKSLTRPFILHTEDSVDVGCRE